jgi:hypothetical protein
VTNIRSVCSCYAYQEDIPRHLHVFSERTLAAYAERVSLSLGRVDHDTRFFGDSSAASCACGSTGCSVMSGGNGSSSRRVGGILPGTNAGAGDR